MTTIDSSRPAPLAPWVGGKRNLARRLIVRIEAIPHTLYAEPFIGMGGVFLRRSRPAQVEAMADALGVTYLGNANFSGSDVLSVTTNDLGNSGAGGPLTDSDNVAITVTAVNDAPSGGDPRARVSRRRSARAKHSRGRHGCGDERGDYLPVKLKSAVLESDAPTFTFMVCVPYFSCHASSS